MSLFLKLFENHTQYEEARQNLILPNVSYCEQENDVHYNPYVPPFFCKLTLNDGSVVKLEGSGELTSAMTSPYIYQLVLVEIGTLCTSIGERAFRRSYSLTSIDIPNSVISIGNEAFVDCDSLTSITISNSVTSIGDYAFVGCISLTSCTIGSGVTSIGEGAFENCSGLISITVDANNTVYDSRDKSNAIIETSTNTLVFGCKATIIPNSVTSIGNDTFYFCSGLTSIDIPNSVTSIGYQAFVDCISLTSVTVRATTPPTLGEKYGYRPFDNTNNCPIYVPSASVETYKSATIWSTYADRIQAIQ